MPEEYSNQLLPAINLNNNKKYNKMIKKIRKNDKERIRQLILEYRKV